MSNAERTGDITGKMSADPTPLPFGQGLRCDLVGNKRSVGSCSYSSWLDPGDILFIDSSHGVKIGGDVNYPSLQVVPRLKPGVIVHIHDVFLPFDYRRDWVMEQFRF